MNETHDRPPQFDRAGYNFMTPSIICWYVSDDKKLAVELSRGTGLDGRTPIYGVTLRPDPANISQMFYSEGNARDFIDTLE